ncbi:unnamed protein product [Echinostoma caproni]|uniref:Uncharacterized protein n=1 Tax=Echinostoma caproni TaxID=27848 RepID=A0A183BD49_9TREM|nr:unnamed protein product [Echinostoma caproni]
MLSLIRFQVSSIELRLSQHSPCASLTTSSLLMLWNLRVPVLGFGVSTR